MKVLGLGYLGIGAPNPRECMSYATEILGMMPTRAVPGASWGVPPSDGQFFGVATGTGFAEDGTAYLKLDDWQWRIAVHQHDKPTLLYLGLELSGPLELEAALQQLASSGCPAESGSRTQAAQRGVTGIGYTQDPAGNRIELFYGPIRDCKFVSSTGTRFVTGNMGLGHINLLVDDLEACQDFYTRQLGFALTDYVVFGDRLSANFYHCNSRHHTIGLTRVGPLNGIHHLMLEVEGIDQVGQCMDRVSQAGIPITASLGQHANDRAVSFYMRAPFGFDVEIGWNSIQLDQDWTPGAFVEGDLWGHKGLTAENIQSAAEEATA